MSITWVDRLQILHAGMFWSIVLTAILKLSNTIIIDWSTLIQLWILNLFVYVFLSLANYLRLSIQFIYVYLFYMSLYVVMVMYGLSRYNI